MCGKKREIKEKKYMINIINASEKEKKKEKNINRNGNKSKS